MYLLLQSSVFEMEILMLSTRKHWNEWMVRNGSTPVLHHRCSRVDNRVKIGTHVNPIVVDHLISQGRPEVMCFEHLLNGFKHVVVNRAHIWFA